STSEIKETVVVFVLSATGNIDEPKIEKSSGNAFFDQAALRAIYQARPFPPFPQGIQEPSLKVHFSFSLTEKS
ncbi:MAG: energy transducer TonB, partial [Nitrospirota bacterium]